jgi:hypothetical protein
MAREYSMEAMNVRSCRSSDGCVVTREFVLSELRNFVTLSCIRLKLQPTYISKTNSLRQLSTNMHFTRTNPTHSSDIAPFMSRRHYLLSREPETLTRSSREKTYMLSRQTSPPQHKLGYGMKEERSTLQKTIRS